MLNKFFTGDKEAAYSESLSSKLSLTCRLIVGGYLIYLAYGLLGSAFSADAMFRKIAFSISIICFVFAGGYFAYSSARDLIIGRFIGGKLDLGQKPVEISDEENAAELADTPEQSSDKETEADKNLSEDKKEEQ